MELSGNLKNFLGLRGMPVPPHPSPYSEYPIDLKSIKTDVNH